MFSSPWFTSSPHLSSPASKAQAEPSIYKKMNGQSAADLLSSPTNFVVQRHSFRGVEEYGSVDHRGVQKLNTLITVPQYMSGHVCYNNMFCLFISSVCFKIDYTNVLHQILFLFSKLVPPEIKVITTIKCSMNNYSLQEFLCPLYTLIKDCDIFVHLLSRLISHLLL